MATTASPGAKYLSLKFFSQRAAEERAVAPGGACNARLGQFPQGLAEAPYDLWLPAIFKGATISSLDRWTRLYSGW